MGPLLFILYINDLPNSTCFFDYILYADDTNIFSSGRNINELIEKTNNELKTIVSWFNRNKLTLNGSKSQMMIFGPVQYLNYKEPYKIMIDSAIIEETKVMKFFGVLLDQNLTFKPHVLHVSTKLSKAIGMINSIKYFVQKNVWIYSIIHCVYHISYIATSYGHLFLKQQLNKLNY